MHRIEAMLPVYYHRSASTRSGTSARPDHSRRPETRDKPGHPVSKSLVLGGAMRYVCVVMLFIWTVGSADVFVADDQQPARGRGAARESQADIPKEFAVLLLSPEQHVLEATKRATYWGDLWKGLPYDSISLERGSGGACVGACELSRTVTLYRDVASGNVVAPLDRFGRTMFPDLRGRAELRTVTVGTDFLPGALPGVQSREPRISVREGSVDIYTFAKLSYLLHRAQFLQLRDRYWCSLCPIEPGYFMLSVAAGGKTKAVIDYQYGYGDGRLVELWAIEQAFDSVSRTNDWMRK
jgi:hypothetical protein